MRARLGERALFLGGDVYLLGIDDLISSAGAAAEGMLIADPLPPPTRLPEAGRRFVAAFGRSIGSQVTTYAVTYAQAADVLLDAIAASDGSRASVTAHLFTTRVTDGILGTFAFDRNGDTTAGAVTIHRIRRGQDTIVSVVTPPPAA